MCRPGNTARRRSPVFGAAGDAQYIGIRERFRWVCSLGGGDIPSGGRWGRFAAGKIILGCYVLRKQALGRFRAVCKRPCLAQRPAGDGEEPRLPVHFQTQLGYLAPGLGRLPLTKQMDALARGTKFRVGIHDGEYVDGKRADLARLPVDAVVDVHAEGLPVEHVAHAPIGARFRSGQRRVKGGPCPRVVGLRPLARVCVERHFSDARRVFPSRDGRPAYPVRAGLQFGGNG